MIRRLLVGMLLFTGTLTVLPSLTAGARPSGPLVPLVGPVAALPTLTCPTGNAPQAVTTDVRLAADLTCSGTVVEWDLAPGVTVDLGGHTLTVASTLRCEVAEPGCTFEVGAGTLRNGRLRGADVRVGDGTAERLGLRDGLAWVAGSGLVTRSVVDGGQVALERGGRLTDSWVVHGDGVLLWNLDHSLTDFQVRGNLIIGNRGAGISLLTHFFFADDVTGTIDHNFIAGNAGAGISLTGDLRDLGAITISGNLAVHNGGTGIVVSGTLEGGPVPAITGGPVTLTGNVALANGGHGIDASWIPSWPSGIVDGGGNRAAGNALSPACIGVTCSHPH